MLLFRYLIQYWIFRRARMQTAVAAYHEAQATLVRASERRNTQSQNVAGFRLRQALHDLMRAELASKKWVRS